MTMMTEATPITTPISVRMERSLFPHRDCSASRKASISGMIPLSVSELGPPISGAGWLAVFGDLVTPDKSAPTGLFQCTHMLDFGFEDENEFPTDKRSSREHGPMPSR